MEQGALKCYTVECMLKCSAPALEILHNESPLVKSKEHQNNLFLSYHLSQHYTALKIPHAHHLFLTLSLSPFPSTPPAEN
jgi:hypothetical protein